MLQRVSISMIITNAYRCSRDKNLIVVWTAAFFASAEITKISFWIFGSYKPQT